MKKIVSSLVGLGLLCGGLFAEDYIVKIGNKDISISSGEVKKVKIGNRLLDVSIVKSKYQLYKSKYVNFKHLNRMNPTHQNLMDGLDQTMMSTALGSVILIQEYNMEVPNNMVNIMKTELNKTNAANIKVTANKDFSQRLIDGKVMKGIAYEHITSGHVTAKVKILTYKRNGKSVLVAELDNNSPELDDKDYKPMSETFWNSLIIK